MSMLWREVQPDRSQWWNLRQKWRVNGESIQCLKGRLGVPFRDDITIIKPREYGHLCYSVIGRDCEIEIIPGEEAQSGLNFGQSGIKTWKTVSRLPRDLAIWKRGWFPVPSCNIEGRKWDCCFGFKYKTGIQRHRWRTWVGGTKRQSGVKGQMSRWWYHQHKGVSWRHR